MVIGSLLLAHRKKWIWAGILAALATLTRNQGIVLALVLFWEGILQYRANREIKVIDIFKILFAAALPVLAFGAFALYMHNGLHADWPWQTLGTIWGHYSGLPWKGIIGNIKQLSTLPVSKDLYWLPTNILDLLMAILIPIILIIHRRSTRSTYLLFAWLILLMGLMKLGPDHTLVSFSRYVSLFSHFSLPSRRLSRIRYSRLAILAIGLMMPDHLSDHVLHLVLGGLSNHPRRK